MAYVGLHNHDEELEFMGNHNHTEISNFRLKDCIVKIPDLINRAIELDYAGVSITDHEALSGHIQFMQRYQELKNLRKKYLNLKNSGKEEEISEDKALQKNLKYIEKDTLDNFKIGLGNEIYLVDSLEEVKDNYTSGVTKFWHFILIAKDEKGYEQIKRISSESAWKNWFKQGRMERVPTIKSEMEKIIGEEKGHIIAQTSCLGGEFPNLVLKYFKHNGDKKDKRRIHDFIIWGKKLFGEENFFLELQPTLETPKDTIEETHDQIVFNQKAIMLAKAYGIGYVFTNDVHYLKKEHRMVHEAYLKSDEDNASNREVGEFYATTYMMEKSELYDLLSSHLTHDEIVEGFKNTMKIHDMIEDYDLSHDVIVPKDNTIPNVTIRHTFKDWYNRCEYIKKFSESHDTQEKYFLYLLEESVLNGKLPMTDEVVYRFDTEMGEIWNISEKLGMRLASYYILVLRIINEVMWKVSYVGIARGSVTGFLTAYAIGITQMNPLKYNLPHWRHLSAERPELPD